MAPLGCWVEHFGFGGSGFGGSGFGIQGWGFIDDGFSLCCTRIADKRLEATNDASRACQVERFFPELSMIVANVARTGRSTLPRSALCVAGKGAVRSVVIQSLESACFPAPYSVLCYSLAESFSEHGYISGQESRTCFCRTIDHRFQFLAEALGICGAEMLQPSKGLSRLLSRLFPSVERLLGMVEW